MGIGEITEGFSGFLQKITNALVFWKNWDDFSFYLVLGLIGFLIFIYWGLKRSAMGSHTKRRRRTKRIDRR